jgi:hypothetical protein
MNVFPACIEVASNGTMNQDQVDALQAHDLAEPLGVNKVAGTTDRGNDVLMNYRLKKPAFVYFVPAKLPVHNDELCYGQLSVGRLLRYTRPTTLGGITSSQLQFTYRVDQVAEWAKADDMQRAFPEIGDELHGAGEIQEVPIVLTHDGWEVQ